MNQTPASILILASAVFCYGANNAATTTYTQASAMMWLAAIGIGIWGVLALISSYIRERELFVDNHARLDVVDRIFLRDSTQRTRPTAPPARTQESMLEIPSEIQTQLNLAAEMEGRDRASILEETLRRHLPKYSKRVA